MKQKIFALLLAVCMAASLLTVPAAAAGETVRFSDIADTETNVAVESLRLMGVLDGYGDGSFRPSAQLNRAQFCKMAVYALNGGSELGLYRAVTVFPDVKSSHWAAAYINMAAKGKNIISGYPDGKFHPEKTVTVGQAVTILLRMLDYKDENVGGVWPDSYMAVGATIGLTDGVGTNGNAPLTRGQAARLFLNLLRADKREGGSYLEGIGIPKADAVLVSSAATGPDGKDNALKTDAGDVYQLATGKTASGLLNGRKGTLLLNKQGMALTFVPDAMGSSRTITIASCSASQITDSSGAKYTVSSKTSAYYNGKATSWGEIQAWIHSGVSATLYLDAAGTVTYVFVGGGGDVSAAVITYEDRSSAGFDLLTNSASHYSLYKNGAPADLSDLRKYDVAIYDASTNSIRVCDTRAAVYYDSCSPSPDEPETIHALGRDFDVLPTARESLSKFKPGSQMVLLLTEGGQVAGAVEPGTNSARGNAVGIVQGGQVRMLCGTAQIEIEAEDAGKFEGQLVRISSTAKDKVNLSALSGGISGKLDVPGKKLGSKKLAENVMIFRDGESLTLNQLTSAEIPSNQILYSRVNWADKVDLIVLKDLNSSNVTYGRVFWESTKLGTDEETGETLYEDKVGVEFGNSKSDRIGPFAMKYNVQTGDFVWATVNRNNSGFSNLVKLAELKNIPNSAWSGKTSVTVGGRSYMVPENVLCYNRDSKQWVTLDQAHAYAGSANLYVKDGIVRVIEVRHQ